MKSLLKLLRSMRFAIGILAVVAVAATIGSVLEQNQPSALYVGNYGAVWAAFFKLTALDDVYHAWWFFALLGFMALSTGLCVWQNAPAMWRDMRSYRENKSVASLRQLEYTAVFEQLDAPELLRPALPRWLRQQGYASRAVVGTDGALLLAGRRGAVRRAGYLLVHCAMVLICIGGLLDGNVWLRLRLWSGAARIETRELAPAAVPAPSRLARNAGSFRATMTVPEGGTLASAMLPFGDGYLLQELPFGVRLKRFRVEHYPSGQPKEFSSDIEIVDGQRTVPLTLQVNKPATYRGVTLYQSGFADGGSAVGLVLTPPGQPAIALHGKIGDALPFLLEGKPATLELGELRLINVFARDEGAPASGWRSQAKPGERVLDAGPSLSLRMRDAQGQAEDWLLYQKPARIDGADWFLLGRRTATDSAMHYWRLPADGKGSLASYHTFAQTLHGPATRAQAAAALAARAADPALGKALAPAVRRLLDSFAARGYRGVADLVPAGSAPAERLRTGQLYAQLLEGALASANPAAPPALLHDMLASYSDSIDAHLPAVLQFTDFTPVNASSIQVTRAPGAKLVYLGAALLALGVMCMYFIPERRLWLRLHQGQLLAAFTANRPSPALAEEFAALRGALATLISSSRNPS